MLYLSFDNFVKVRTELATQFRDLMLQDKLTIEEVKSLYDIVFNVDKKLTSDIEIFREVRDQIDEGRYI